MSSERSCSAAVGIRPPQDVAVDVHSERLAVLAQNEQGEDLWRKRFWATESGEEELIARLGPGDRVVLEATRGSYRLANRLEASGATVIIMDPGELGLLGRNGKKTDFRDDAAMLTHLRNGKYTAVWRPDAETRAIRFLAVERLALNQNITRTKNRMHALLHEEGVRFPGALVWGEEGREWLTQQTLPEGSRQILLRSWRSLQVAQLLKAEAEQEELAQIALSRPDVARLMQVMGFGMAISVFFLGQVGDVRRFHTAKQLVSYAGLNPRVHQSDRHTRYGPISKAGRSTLRWLMIEAAWVHVRHDGPLAHVYHRLLRRGKNPAVAIVALARKLLVLAYTLLRDETPYRDLNPPRYERKLVGLAAKRPESEEPQETHRDWAAERFGQVTGQTSPYRQQHPEPRPRRVRRPVRPAVGKGEAAAKGIAPAPPDALRPAADGAGEQAGAARHAPLRRRGLVGETAEDRGSAGTQDGAPATGSGAPPSLRPASVVAASVPE